MKLLRIAQREVGPGTPVFVIAEAGVNHNGSLDLARALIDRAVDAGADAVKFQTFDADRLVTADAPKADYQQQAVPAEKTQREMLRALQLDATAHRALAAHCAMRGILFLSTPFDEASADLLRALDLPAYKISSGDLTNLPLLQHVAAMGRPMIVSTGMADLAEVEAALAAIRTAGAPPVALLHCVSQYPAPAHAANLRAMATLQAAFGVPVGRSDHTVGHAVSWAAVALGAAIIEKHITLDRALPGPDHAASMEPVDFRAFVAGIRAIESALGDGRKRPSAEELRVASVARRSVVALCDIAPGHLIGATDVGLKRPGMGLPASMLPKVLGRRARCAIAAGTLLALELLE